MTRISGFQRSLAFDTFVDLDKTCFEGTGMATTLELVVHPWPLKIARSMHRVERCSGCWLDDVRDDHGVPAVFGRLLTPARHFTLVP